MRPLLRLWWLLLLASCAAPEGDAAEPCGPNGSCPAGQTCEARSQTCVKTGGDRAGDAGTDARPPEADGRPDAAVPSDARPDGAAAGADARADAGAAGADAGADAAAAGADAGADAEAAPPDSGAPLRVTITSPREGETIAAGAQLSFTVSDTAASIMCAFDGGELLECGVGTAGSFTMPPLPPGAHSATVRALFPGRRGDAVVHFDVADPGLRVRLVPRSTPCANEVIAFFASVEGATFSCDLDGAVTPGCTSPFALPINVAGGPHRFTVTASAGGATASATTELDLDRQSPRVEVTTDASKALDPAGTISFAATETVTARCHLDDGPTVDCTSGSSTGSFAYSGLADRDNEHRFFVDVTDVCGLRGAAILAFSVDSTPPKPCLVDVETTGARELDGHGECLTEATVGRAGSLTFAAEPGSYLCQITTVPVAGQPAPASSPPLDARVACAPGQPLAFTGLSDFNSGGHPYDLVVEGLDVHGNASRTALRFGVDTSGPLVFLRAATPDPRRGELVVAYETTSAPEAPTFPVCALDGIPCDCGPSSVTCHQVSAGAHELRVAARDAFGNGGAAAIGDPTMTYGPAGGRAILLGFDLDASNGDSVALLRAAVGEVPWRVSGAFDRPLRVVFFEAGRADPSEAANIDAALAGLVDGARSTMVADRDPDGLAAALAGRDVLLVLDQNDAASARATGERWGDDPRLRGFLDAGGVVVVLDGWSGLAGGVPVVSDTWQVLAGGDDPILRVQGARVNAPVDRAWSYAPSRSEQVFGLSSELRVAEVVAPADGAVTFDVDDAELSRVPYVVPFLGAAPMLEEIFPFYGLDINVSGVVSPGAGFTMDTSLAPQDVSALQCSLEVVTCFNVSGCCPGGAAVGHCACPVLNEAAHAFELPSRSGIYVIEGRVLSPRAPLADPTTETAPRPGRTAASLIVVPEPRLAFHAAGDGRFCYHGTATLGGAMTLAQLRPQLLTASGFVDLNPESPAGCPDPDDIASISACAGRDGGTVSLRLLAQDGAGNTNEAVLINQAVPGCVIF